MNCLIVQYAIRSFIITILLVININFLLPDRNPKNYSSAFVAHANKLQKKKKEINSFKNFKFAQLFKSFYLLLLFFFCF